jgi:Flp pilus assembly protein TadD
VDVAGAMAESVTEEENMSRKSKQSKHKKKITASLSPVDIYLDLIGHQIFHGNYAEAEAALKRALVMDPRYTLAKNNLAALPEIRRTGPPTIVDIRDPFKTSKLKQSITFLKE